LVFVYQPSGSSFPDGSIVTAPEGLVFVYQPPGSSFPEGSIVTAPEGWFSFINLRGLLSLKVPSLSPPEGWFSFINLQGLLTLTVPSLPPPKGWFSFINCQGLLSLLPRSAVIVPEKKSSARLYHFCTRTFLNIRKSSASTVYFIICQYIHTMHNTKGSAVVSVAHTSHPHAGIPVWGNINEVTKKFAVKERVTVSLPPHR
jgi:hypothetical protein